MKKLLLLFLLLPVFAFAEAGVNVTARYDFWETLRFVNQSTTLQVFDDGTSAVSLQFTHAPHYVEPIPEEAIIRLLKVDGVEGDFGSAPLVFNGKNGHRDCVFTATIPLDRALGKSTLLTFMICKPDGTQKYRIKARLDDFDSASGKWPMPESTPPLHTIPPVAPTATPTPRPRLSADATEPPQDTVQLTVPFQMREYTASYIEKGATLRIYEDMSVLTIQFQYEKDVPEGTVFRMTMVDGRMGIFGEGEISAPDAQGNRTAVILFSQQVGLMKNFNLEAYAPGQPKRLFKAFYTLDKRAGKYGPQGWSDMPQLSTLRPATPTPVPTPDASSIDFTEPTAIPGPTVALTESPRANLIGEPRYTLLDPVKWFGLKSAYLRRYDNGICALEVKFTYSGELPATPVLRIVQREYEEGNFGEAIVTRDAKTDVLSALIITDRLHSSMQACRLKCYDEKGNELFYADLKSGTAYKVYSGPYGSNYDYMDYGAAIARNMLPTATPEPRETPLPTPTMAATANPAASSTPLPTEPPYSDARSKRNLLLVDKVKNYAHYNVALRRYEEFDVLSVFFRYKGSLPEGTVLRLIRVDHLLDRYGEAPILPAELKNASADLLCAKIVSDRIPLNPIGMRAEAVTPEGEVLFTVDFYPDVKGFTAENARKLLGSEHPEPSDTPTPTPEVTVAPSL